MSVPQLTYLQQSLPHTCVHMKHVPTQNLCRFYVNIVVTIIALGKTKDWGHFCVIFVCAVQLLFYSKYFPFFLSIFINTIKTKTFTKRMYEYPHDTQAGSGKLWTMCIFIKTYTILRILMHWSISCTSFSNNSPVHNTAVESLYFQP